MPKELNEDVKKKKKKRYMNKMEYINKEKTQKDTKINSRDEIHKNGN